MKCAAAVTTLALALIGAASASGAPGPVFTIVGQTSAQPVLPSAEVPNAEGSLLLPPGWTVSTLTPTALSFAELSLVWHRAGAAYGIPWQVLAAINKIESNFGRNMGPSSAGAVGWMQFMPSTWLRWGTDAKRRRSRRSLGARGCDLLGRALPGGRGRAYRSLPGRLRVQPRGLVRA